MNIDVTVVIPVYNEELILEEALLELLENLRAHQSAFEVIISANGCVDQTEAIAERLASLTQNRSSTAALSPTTVRRSSKASSGRAAGW